MSHSRLGKASQPFDSLSSGDRENFFSHDRRKRQAKTMALLIAQQKMMYAIPAWYDLNERAAR